MPSTFTDPTKAREYIAMFSKHTLKGTNMVRFEGGEEVHFDTMTDEQAVRVANGFASIEAEAAKRSTRRKGFRHA